MQVFDPVIRWAEEQWGAQLQVGTGLMGMQQSPHLLAGARAYLTSAPPLQSAHPTSSLHGLVHAAALRTVSLSKEPRVSVSSAPFRSCQL